MKIFGIIGLLITVALVTYTITLQFRQLETGEVGEGASRYGVTKPGSIIDEIDLADDAARALEVRNKIPEDLLR